MNLTLKLLLPQCRLLAGWLLALASCVQAAPLQEKLFGDLRNWVATQNNAAPEQVRITPLDARVQVQECFEAPIFDYPFANRDSVRVRCAKPNWQLFIKVALAQPQNSVVAAHSLKVGQVLVDSDLVMKPDFAPVAGSFRERELLIGRQLKRALGKGQTLLAQDLETSLQAVRFKQAMRAGQLLTDSAVERFNLPRQSAPPSVWLGSELAPGTRLARDVQAGQVMQNADLSQSRQIVVAASNLNAGQMLQAGLLRLEPIEAEKITRAHLFETGGLEGSELIRAVRAGEPIRPADLRPAVLVKRGELVQYTVGKATQFQVTVKLEALQDGRMGEQIKLRNSDSGRTLSGIVSGQGMARGM